MVFMGTNNNRTEQNKITDRLENHSTAFQVPSYPLSVLMVELLQQNSLTELIKLFAEHSTEHFNKTNLVEQVN